MGFSRQEYWSGLPCPPPGESSSGDIEWYWGALGTPRAEHVLSGSLIYLPPPTSLQRGWDRGPWSPGLSILFCLCFWVPTSDMAMAMPGSHEDSRLCRGIWSHPRNPDLRRPDSVQSRAAHFPPPGAQNCSPSNTRSLSEFPQPVSLTNRASVPLQSCHTRAEHSSDPASHQAWHPPQALVSLGLLRLLDRNAIEISSTSTRFLAIKSFY